MSRLIKREVSGQIEDVIEFIFNSFHHQNAKRVLQVKSELEDISAIIVENPNKIYNHDAAIAILSLQSVMWKFLNKKVGVFEMKAQLRELGERIENNAGILTTVARNIKTIKGSVVGGASVGIASYVINNHIKGLSILLDNITSISQAQGAVDTGSYIISRGINLSHYTLSGALTEVFNRLTKGISTNILSEWMSSISIDETGLITDVAVMDGQLVSTDSSQESNYVINVFNTIAGFTSEIIDYTRGGSYAKYEKRMDALIEDATSTSESLVTFLFWMTALTILTIVVTMMYSIVSKKRAASKVRSIAKKTAAKKQSRRSP